MEERTWTVVRFTKDDTVEAVPTTWIYGNECYWPPFVKEKLVNAIKHHEKPEKNWTSFEIQVFRNSTYDSYLNARNKANRAVDTSDLNSDLESGKRRIIVRKKYCSSSSEDEYGFVSQLPKPPSLKQNSATVKNSQKNRDKQNKDTATVEVAKSDSETIKATNIILNQEIDPDFRQTLQLPTLESSVYTTLQRNTAKKNALTEKPINLGNQQPSTSSVPTTAENTNANLCKDITKEQDYCQCVCKLHKMQIDTLEDYLKKLLRKQNLLSAQMTDLAEEVRNIALINGNDNNNPSNNEASIFSQFDLPLTNQQCLDEMEEYLKDKKNFNALVNELSFIGGSNIYEITKRMLSRLIGDELASGYSWYGAKKKKVFGPLHLCRVVVESGLKLKPTATEKEFEEATKNWLRRAKERVQAKNKKNEAKN